MAVVLPFDYYDPDCSGLGAATSSSCGALVFSSAPKYHWFGQRTHVVDDCTTERRRVGFAWICIQTDLSQSLHPKVLINGPKGNRWQKFIYENLTGMYFRCGFFHGSGKAYPGSGSGEPVRL